MININGKDWNIVDASDIKWFIKTYNQKESFFLELKSGKTDNGKVVKEISAFSNTYGGYLIIGAENDRTISGKLDWNEEKVHTVLYNSISPLPIIDVKEFEIDNESVLVVRVEEGDNPPYVTNKGKIYTRLSSGSFPITDNSNLLHLYNKRRDREAVLQSKLQLPAIDFGGKDNNLAGYIDLGFQLNTSSPLGFDKDFYEFDFSLLEKSVHEIDKDICINLLGDAIYFTSHSLKIGDDSYLLPGGLENYMVIYKDGSCKMRLVYAINEEDDKVDISYCFLFYTHFRDIYSSVIGEDLTEKFISAKHFELLEVLHQFTPDYTVLRKYRDESKMDYDGYVNDHYKKYGMNKIVAGGRIPATGFLTCDKKTIEDNNIPFDHENLVSQLFHCSYIRMGFIDPIENYIIED